MRKWKEEWGHYLATIYLVSLIAIFIQILVPLSKFTVRCLHIPSLHLLNHRIFQLLCRWFDKSNRSYSKFSNQKNSLFKQEHEWIALDPCWWKSAKKSHRIDFYQSWCHTMESGRAHPPASEYRSTNMPAARCVRFVKLFSSEIGTKPLMLLPFKVIVAKNGPEETQNSRIYVKR